jgi:5-methylcytosine-specific restriction endonuclease McrA
MLTDEERKACHRQRNREWARRLQADPKRREARNAQKRARLAALPPDASAERRKRRQEYQLEWRAARAAGYLERARERDRARGFARRQYQTAKSRAWYQANRERARQNQAQRTARLRGAGEVERIIRREVYERDQGCCYLCSRPVPSYHGRDMHVEHIVPVSKGGSHILSNVATSCHPCNQRKRATLPPLDRVPAYARAYVEAFLSAAQVPTATAA